MAFGAWNIFFDWLKEAEACNIWPLVKELLKAFVELPLNIDLLRINHTPKIIRRLSKRLDIDTGVDDVFSKAYKQYFSYANKD